MSTVTRPVIDKKYFAADLFCGAGGTSTGLINALTEHGYGLDDIDLIAINHWSVAISTHSANHPFARHLCESLDNVNPRQVVPGGYLDLLVASPECTHHSRARGGKPINDQSRASAWHILRWAEALYIKNILIENVPEFMTWGPLDRDGSPVQNLKGQTFLSFIGALQSLGYTVSYRLLTAADYGDPTTRKRLFIQARREDPICWPEPTHGKVTQSMFGDVQPWRSAREIIDWSIPGKSIFNRDRPLKPNTMRRIMRGLEKYSGLPFVICQQSSAAPRSVDDPVPTVAGSGAIGLAQPYIVELYGKSNARSIDDPLPTVTAGGEHTALCEPFLVEYHGGRDRLRSINEPLPTQDCSNRFALCEPYLVTCNHGDAPNRSYPVNQPMPTVTSVDAWGIVEPYLIKYNGTGGAVSIDEPLDTVTAKDRFGLVIPLSDGGSAVVDILFRMLQPNELAAAMSFPADYRFDGDREQKVKQIGNAVPRRLAKALCSKFL